MRVITVARKPLSESTVAKNVVKHGTGGLNIDASRVEGVWDDPRPRQAQDIKGGNFGGGNGQGPDEDLWKVPHKTGRWPANVILQHKQGCERVGTKKVKGNRVDTRPEGDGGRDDKSQWRFRPTEATRRGYSNEGGTEKVDAWICELGCPVADLDEQSGVLTSGGLYPHHKRHAPRFGSGGVYGKDLGGALSSNGRTFASDKGGASRYFKQVGGGDQ